MNIDVVFHCNTNSAGGGTDDNYKDRRRESHREAKLTKPSQISSVALSSSMVCSTVDANKQSHLT